MLNFLLNYRRAKRQIRDKAMIAYTTTVDHIRDPDFYGSWQLEDNFDNRFELLIYHLDLILFALNHNNKPSLRHSDAKEDRAIAQGLFDIFCRDIEDILREKGVTDFGIPKKMKKVAEAFYGRAASYRTCFSADATDDLSQAIARNIYKRDKRNALSDLAASYGLDTVKAWNLRDNRLWLDDKTGAIFWPVKSITLTSQ